MKAFKDKNGTEWTLSFDLVSTKRVKDQTNLDLLDIGEGGALLSLGANPYRAAEVLFWLVEPQTKERNVECVAFMQSLDGDIIEHAIELLWEDAISFFPSNRRPAFQAAVSAMKQARTIAHEAAEKALTNNPRIEQAVRASCDRLIAEMNAGLDRQIESSREPSVA